MLHPSHKSGLLYQSISTMPIQNSIHPDGVLFIWQKKKDKPGWVCPFGAGDVTRFRLRHAQTMELLGPALASDSPPDCHILWFESRNIKKDKPGWVCPFGAGDVTRTRDLLITSEMHYRLCYTSIQPDYYTDNQAECQLIFCLQVFASSSLSFSRMERRSSKVSGRFDTSRSSADGW